MAIKLKLKLEKEIIEKRNIMRLKKLSLSRIIENYLNSLTSDKQIMTYKFHRL